MKPTHLLAITALAATLGAHAQTTPASAPAPTAAAAASAPQSEGEVRRIDKAQGKLTLRHGPLENLGMPGMTMIFKVADPKMLEGLKDGDKVRFTADKVNGAFTVTAIQPARQ